MNAPNPAPRDRAQEIIVRSRKTMAKILELFDNLDSAISELEQETRRQSGREISDDAAT